MNFGLIPHGVRADADELLRRLGDELVAEGHSVRALDKDAERVGRPEWGVAEDGFGQGLHLVVTLGGDGTVLRAVSLTPSPRVPLLAVNLGQLGYLAEVEPGTASGAVRRFIEGRYRIETRMTVAGQLEPEGWGMEGLNEVVLTGEVGRLASIACLIDEAEFTVYRCDALIVATSTGSTAYALSAGGPIVSPGLDCLIVVPVAPHGLFNRPLVLRPDDGLILRLASDQPASVSVDGRLVGVMSPGDEVHLGAGEEEVPFVRLTDLDFLAILREKFGPR
jgi:NAD+ kinase